MPERPENSQFEAKDQQEIDTYDPFDSKAELDELKAKLSAMPPEERKIRRSEAFDQLALAVTFQSEEIAIIANQLEQYKAQNPRAGSEELLNIVRKHAPRAKLSPKQLEIFEQKINRLITADLEAEQSVSQFQEKYPDEWQKKLFFEHFQFVPKDEVGVATGSGALIFEVHSRADWLSILKWREEENGQTQRGSIGFVIADKADGKQYHIGAALVNHGKFRNMLMHPMQDSIVHHEAKHAQDFTLEPLTAGTPEVKKLIQSSGLDKDSTDEEVKKIAESAINLGEDSIFRYIRSELLAYIKNADYFFDNASDTKQILGSIAINTLGKIKNGKARKIAKIYAHGMEGDTSRTERNAAIIEYFGNVVARPKSGDPYNYANHAATSLSSSLMEQTGRDCYDLVSGLIQEHFSYLQPRLLDYIDAAISIMKHTRLEGREVDWLLQNEPMQHWPSIARAMSSRGNHIQ